MGEFSEQEKKALEPFVSNTDKDVFALMNLPEVIKGALFSRYSRSGKSLRRLLLDEFMGEIGASTAKGEDLKAAIQKAQGFYERILDGYGDDSVGELGGAHLACENVSNIAAKFLENPRVGGSPLEKSTRYVWFNTKVNGEFMFYKEPKIMKSRHSNSYMAINRLLFETYSKLIEPMSAFMIENFPIEDFEFFDIGTKKSISFIEINDEKLKKMATAAYNSSVRAKTCDVLRGLLPASTLTNVGIFGNGRFFQNLLTKMHSNNLTEIRELGASIHDELNTTIPSFVKRAKPDQYAESVRQDMESISKEILGSEKAISTEDVELVHYDKETEIIAIATMLYPYSKLTIRQIINRLKNSDIAEIKAIMDSYFGKRTSRRDKAGRALEHVYYTFDLLTDFGIYRDLQRHRIMTQERQKLTVEHGYLLPEEIAKAGFRKDFEFCMEQAKDIFMQISEEMPDEAQYVVPMAYKVRWYAKLNLREAFHLIELRTVPQGHASYRKVGQKMFSRIESVHPALAYYMKFVDMNDYSLGRLNSEMKKEGKKIN